MTEWLRKEVPLGEVAVHFHQDGQLVGSLDALGDHAHADVLGERQDRTHDLFGFAAHVKVCDKRPVDLQGIDREQVEVAQRGVPDSEVIPIRGAQEVGPDEPTVLFLRRQ